MPDPEKPSNERRESRAAAWLPIGIGIGVVVGVALDNIGLGIAIGTAIGVALMAAQHEKSRRK